MISEERAAKITEMAVVGAMTAIVLEHRYSPHHEKCACGWTPTLAQPGCHPDLNREVIEHVMLDLATKMKLLP